MAPPGKPSDRLHREAEYAVERYRREGGPIMQNGRGPIPNGRAGPVMMHGGPGSYYSSDIAPYGYQGNAVAIPQKRIPDNTTHNSTLKAQQNNEAIVRHNKKKDKGAKGKVREGKHAAAVDQIHENDLHNIVEVTHMEENKKNGDSQPNGRRYLNLYGEYIDGRQPSGLHHRPTVRPPKDVLDPDTELKTVFDPIRDRHMWTMWRTAVNGRIVDEVRRLERVKNERGPDAPELVDNEAPGVYGKAIVAPPLRKFIRFDERSMEMAKELSNLGQGRLQTSQFVYYGLPRVYMPSASTQQGIVQRGNLAIANGPPSDGSQPMALVPRQTYTTHL